MIDLPIPPPKLVDTWRIEGEAPDLHLHQAVLHFPLIHLRDPLLGFPFGKPSLILYSLDCFCDRFVVVREPPTLLWVVPRIVVVRAPDSALKDSDSGR